MYNHLTDVKGQGDRQLRMAVELAFENIPGKKIVSWSARSGELRLYWRYEPRHEFTSKLPFPAHFDSVFHLISGWLENCPDEAYLEGEDDMDGSQEPRGFRLQAMESEESYLAIRVSPLWCLYPK